MTTPEFPAGTVAAFLTLGGATVVLIEHPNSKRYEAFTWHCLGCGAMTDYGAPRGRTRDQANDHAAGCRSIPLPTGD